MVSTSEKRLKKRYACHVRPSYRSSHFVSTISGQSIVLHERKENREFGLAKSVECDFLIGFCFAGFLKSSTHTGAKVTHDHKRQHYLHFHFQCFFSLVRAFPVFAFCSKFFCCVIYRHGAYIPSCLANCGDNQVSPLGVLF